jgi:hypothetical protein
LTRQLDLILLPITVIVDTIAVVNARRCFRSLTDAHVRPAPDRRGNATGEPIEPGEHDLAMLTANSERLSELRKRLANLSWFMRCLCEKIARVSNHEDGSSGRFFELGGNRARVRSTIQAGGGAIELARRCRGAPFAAPVPRQGGGSNHLCVTHWLDAEL